MKSLIMKKPEEQSSGPDFSEYMWMAEDGAEAGLEQQLEEEMQLIEQDFLEAMFDDMLREEDEKETYYTPPDEYLEQMCNGSSGNTAQNDSMQLPKIESTLNPNAPEFVPRFTQQTEAR